MVVLTEIQSSGRSDEAVLTMAWSRRAGPRGSCLVLASAAPVKQKASKMGSLVPSLPLRENCGDAAPASCPDRSLHRRDDYEEGGHDVGGGRGRREHPLTLYLARRGEGVS
jgi:hypothetical protein